AYEPWPAHDEAKLARETMVIAVQVGGKVRGQVEVPVDASAAAVIAAARAEPGIQRALAGRAPTREIYVPGRLVSLVVSGP
ncbi:MAG TPA: hypothetical protein VEH80_08140, partial [Candidatus Bathyarchaeia archaeon]|nr:hypothetical protein [Candidatus Bathyarchaeia archaeon]